MKQKYILYFLITLLACSGIAFADELPEVVVKVNDVSITLADVEEEIDRIIFQTLFHRNIPFEKRASYRKEAIERLIDRELQFKEAKTQGIKAEKKEIKNRIEKIKKRFPSDKEFEKALQHNKLTVKDLETAIEKEILIEKLFKAEVEDKTVVPDEEIKAHYEGNTQRYRELEQVRLRHIVLRFDKEIRTKEEARAMAEELLKRIRKGEDFATLAHEYSEDPYRVKGGDIGYIHRGRMIQEIEAQAFDAKIGEIRGPLETEYGFYIIKLEDRKPERQFSFDEVKDKIKDELVEKKKAERTKEWLKSLREKARVEYLQH